MTSMRSLLLLAFLLALSPSAGAVDMSGRPWPQVVKAIKYRTAADDTDQPAMFYAPPGDEPRPLVIALHTWSHGHRQLWSVPYARWAIDKGWVFMHPEFRGPNKRPQATASDLVVADILSAVAYAKQHAKVDDKRVYLIGYSSGGLAALRAAAAAPELFAGVSVWGAVTDLRQWHAETRRLGLHYAGDIEASVGGVPTEGSAAAEECRKRSAMTYIQALKGVPLDLNAGLFDGHGGLDIVPVRHTLHAFNALAAPADRLAAADIATMTERRSVPDHLGPPPEDAAYGKTEVLLRRQSGKARLTVFKAGHVVVYDAGLAWLAGQSR